MGTTEACRLRWPLHLGMITKRRRIIIHFRLQGKQLPTGADGMGPFVLNSSHWFKEVGHSICNISSLASLSYQQALWNIYEIMTQNIEKQKPKASYSPSSYTFLDVQLCTACLIRLCCQHRSQMNHTIILSLLSTKQVYGNQC